MLRARYGLDQPVGRQLAAFLGGVRGATSACRSSTAGRLPRCCAERLPATLLLGGSVLLLNFTLGLWLGVRQAVRRGSREDRWLTTVRSPATRCRRSGWAWCWRGWSECDWRLLPAAGMQDPLLSSDARFLARAGMCCAIWCCRSLTLSVVSIAATMRYQRAAMLEVLRLPYIVTARAKGLPERGVTWRHAWRNALFPDHHPVRSLASDPGDRVGVRRGGVRLARAGIAGGRRRGQPGLSPADGRLAAGRRAGRCRRVR